MTNIKTEYLAYPITFDEAENQWVCEELGLRNWRLAALKKVIDAQKMQDSRPPLKVRYISDMIRDADNMYAFVTSITPESPAKHRVMAFHQTLASHRVHAFEDFAFDTPENSLLIDEWLFLRAQSEEAIWRTRKAKQAIPRCNAMELLGLGVPIVKLIE